MALHSCHSRARERGIYMVYIMPVCLSSFLATLQVELFYVCDKLDHYADMQLNHKFLRIN